MLFAMEKTTLINLFLVVLIMIQIINKRNKGLGRNGVVRFDRIPSKRTKNDA